MAINPNTDFTTGAVLTAAQQNRFPRGIMAYNEVTVNDTSITAEEVRITGSSFTAVANRYYKVTYFEPNPSGGTGYFTFRIRSTNLAGTQRQSSYHTAGFGIERTGLAVWVGTLSAGATNFVGTVQMSAGTGIVAAGATFPAFLMVEDIGPA
jgi:hypothetical protein